MACEQIKYELAEGMKESWICREIGEGRHLVTTSALLPNNDCITLLVERRAGRTRVHDMAASYVFLCAHGMNVHESAQKNRHEQVHARVARYGAYFRDEEVGRDVEEMSLWETLSLVVEAVKDVCGLVETRRANPERNFTEQVYTFFRNHGANAKREFAIPGFTKKRNVFDIRLNTADEVLIKTISTADASRVQNSIERAYYAFDDVRLAGRQFEQAVVIDDTDEERRAAWRTQHFTALRKREIKTYALEQNRDQLERLAAKHRN